MASVTSVLSVSVSIMLSLGEMKGGDRLSKPYNAGPPLVDLVVLVDLNQPLGEPRRDAPSVNTANFQRNKLAHAILNILKQPIRVFLTLHPAEYAPRSISMRQHQRNYLRAVLRDSIVVVLGDPVQASPRPLQRTVTPDVFKVQRNTHSRVVRVPLECERRALYHRRSTSERQPRVHLPQFSQVEIHDRRLPDST